MASAEFSVYAGVGARATPDDVLGVMYLAAQFLSADGLLLRSGGAVGADTAFERGSRGMCDVIRPYECTPEEYQFSSRFHPAWDKCSEETRTKHGRNAMIVMGRDLRSPVDFVICWTPNGEVVGGTGQALRIAYAHGIPVCNLAVEDFQGADFVRPQGRLF